MKKLKSLTPEQEKLMHTKAKEWIDFALGGDNSIREDWKEQIDWLYEFSGLDKPKTKIKVASPMGMQLAVASVRDSVRDSVGDSVGDSVWASVKASVGDSVRASVWDSVWDSDIEYIETSLYGNIGDYGWVSFYDYFDSIIPECIPESFRRFREFLKAGFYDMIQLKDLCIVCERPIKVVRNEAGLMHNPDGPCIEWSDGFKLYAINGRILPSWIWEDKDTISKERFLSERNAEIKAGMYAVLGQEKVAELLGTYDVVSKTANGETLTLLRTKETFDEIGGNPFQWVRCVCPSTNTTYTLGVSHEETCPIEAMARNWGVTKEEYIINQHT